ncbi:MAG: PLP-dependent aminotransferase family protein [Thermoplasmata archaeon]|nr:PLP-dependent aminotransferase family protein [Thermoplasmata archaeon]
MNSGFERLYSEKAKRVVASEVREILKLMHDPDLISFAGGMPNPETFPVNIIKEITLKIFDDSPADVLQYGITEGYPPLRKCLSEYMCSEDIDCNPDSLMITSGATQAIALACDLLADPGATVMTESPTFLAAIICFRNYGTNIEGFPMDDDGVITDSMEERLREMKKKGIHSPLFYTIPNFQNPTGVTLTEKRRKKLVDLSNEYDFLILEDDPYRLLRFEGEDIPPIKKHDDTGRVIYASSFSKILSPGMRLGWMIADPSLIRKMTLIKQTSDVSTNVLSQKIAEEYISGGYLKNHLPKIQKFYGHKQKVMISALKKYFPKDVKWTHPQGGMFLWAELASNIDTNLLLKKAIKKKVAFVQGRCFFPDHSGKNTMRLSFSYPSDENIEEGIRRLAELISEEI